MDANDPVEIFTTSDLAQAKILKGVLEGEGIRCDLEGENQGSFTGILPMRSSCVPKTKPEPARC